MDKLKEVGFIPSQVDECLAYIGKSVFVLYTDDSILAGPDPRELEKIVKEMKAVGLKLTVEGDISDFLGVQIDRVNDNTFNLSQPHLINDVIKEFQHAYIDSTGKQGGSLEAEVLLLLKTFAYYRVLLHALRHCFDTSKPLATNCRDKFATITRQFYCEACLWVPMLVTSRA